MRYENSHGRDEQLELAGQVSFGSNALPSVRPTADAELEEMFLRAASAWARWRERQRWGVQ